MYETKNVNLFSYFIFHFIYIPNPNSLRDQRQSLFNGLLTKVKTWRWVWQVENRQQNPKREATSGHMQQTDWIRWCQWEWGQTITMEGKEQTGSERRHNRKGLQRNTENTNGQETTNQDLYFVEAGILVPFTLCYLMGSYEQLRRWMSDWAGLIHQLTSSHKWRMHYSACTLLFMVCVSLLNITFYMLRGIASGLFLPMLQHQVDVSPIFWCSSF